MSLTHLLLMVAHDYHKDLHFPERIYIQNSFLLQWIISCCFVPQKCCCNNKNNNSKDCPVLVTEHSITLCSFEPFFFFKAHL